ncbi:ATP-dependent protease ATPase subunit HslU [Kosmotoga olearia]|uniref:ATP-dependent protease ATPase subunit HslU n=1 Tax=Kosmotoga olearia (strain ATCC BAA-1733 / DSM 21960 / TBF 19.5.1) TaxID=521045 RepID=C5CFD4_KOSOT|nr:ATP-dependent protease ATPase subunit HslU [Kosmotoga olearia]ACR80343.1 heat shock protein HslVU, ATPase subunit HslU [Kosmotoga olearia TBF 19.5.1]MDK2953322.1 ATP-dependent HslUV protease ATP-binding subunit HslU [Kosmotoga sp.]
MPQIDEDLAQLTPKKIVEELDKYIVGQAEAKRAVAVALRNRIRRQKLPEDVRKEIIPKNILMIGPTGVGKTEIARRLAELSKSPFIKVEATRFTEVGYVGKNVDSMIRELVAFGVNMVKQEKMKEVEEKAKQFVEDRILEALVPGLKHRAGQPKNIFELFQGVPQQRISPEEAENLRRKREEYRQKLRDGELENLQIEIELEEQPKQMIMIPGMEEMGIDMSGMFGDMLPKRKKKKRMSVAEARKVLLPIESEKLLDMDKVIAEAIERVENRGIVFIDEIDKVTARGSHGPDVSREGVQRDLLPIIEGTTINTKYGPVRTDFILFIAAGAFHLAKPSDLIPEFQGRFPIRVELNPLTEQDFLRILTEPKNAITKQYKALLETEGITLEFTEAGLKEIARVAHDLNERIENIGARRLYTVVEKVLEEISFEAPDVSEPKVIITEDYVNTRIKEILADEDLSAFIL